MSAASPAIPNGTLPAPMNSLRVPGGRHLIAQDFWDQIRTPQIREEQEMIKSVLVAAFVAVFAMGSAMAQESCETKAVGKDGKALAGAAKSSFMKKCMADSCATKAMSADGKPLAGAAKNSFMKKCEKGA
jgi:hypothetical protein